MRFAVLFGREAIFHGRAKVDTVLLATVTLFGAHLRCLTATNQNNEDHHVTQQLRKSVPRYGCHHGALIVSYDTAPSVALRTHSSLIPYLPPHRPGL